MKKNPCISERTSGFGKSVALLVLTAFLFTSNISAKDDLSNTSPNVGASIDSSFVNFNNLRKAGTNHDFCGDINEIGVQMGSTTNLLMRGAVDLTALGISIATVSINGVAGLAIFALTSVGKALVSVAIDSNEYNKLDPNQRKILDGLNSDTYKITKILPGLFQYLLQKMRINEGKETYCKIKYTKKEIEEYERYLKEAGITITKTKQH